MFLKYGFLPCSPNTTTNSEYMNLNFHKLFDQSEQAFLVLFVYVFVIVFVRSNLIGKIRGASGFVISGLVVGSGKQDISEYLRNFI